MTSIALNNENQFELLSSDEMKEVGGGEPVSTLTVGAVLAIGAAGLLVGAAVALAVWYFSG